MTNTKSIRHTTYKNTEIQVIKHRHTNERQLLTATNTCDLIIVPSTAETMVARWSDLLIAILKAGELENEATWRKEERETKNQK